jgi:HEPN domain-containing protein
MIIKENKSTKMAESFLHRAWNKLDEAKEHLKHFHYAESISSSQECIELSIKAIFLLLQKEYPKKHEFKENEFEEILKKIPEQLKYLGFPKLYLYSRFWLQFYSVAKYGLEKIGIGPEKLFEKEEAELALKHANKSKYAAGQLLNYIKHKVKQDVS